MIRTRGLEVTVGEIVLFHGLDLDVGAGECVVLTGPNGTGKSTLLRCLYGTQRATEGEVTVGGARPDERSAAFRRRVAVVLDDSALFDELTPRQHLDLLRSFPGAAAPEDVFAGSGLEQRADVPAADLSAGQGRRLLLLGAVTRPHDVLLLDEPERALDAEGRDWLAELITARKAAGAAVVVASHHPGLADRIADSVVDLG